MPTSGTGSRKKAKQKKDAPPPDGAPQLAAVGPGEAAAAAPPPTDKAAAAAAAKADANQDAHPFALGAVLLARWNGDNSDRLCTVIERAKEEDSEDYKYYVHYLDFNRRMDEWIDVSRVLEPPSVAAEKAKARQAELAAAHAAHGELADPGSTSPVGDEGRARRRKRKQDDSDDEEPDGHTAVDDMEHDEHEGLDDASLKEHEEVTKIKNIDKVELGRHVMETWYFSPFPKEYYPSGHVDCLYFCEFSFAFFRHKTELARYQRRSGVRPHPPGNEIYRHDHISMFEVDGSEQKEYCQNLCYFAKLFLDHKTLYYDVDPFLFYVMCEMDSDGFHPVGYYSKEKYSEVGYNLACILTFPAYQRKGYGRFLISFSYELSKKEGKVGSPEKPLSDLGHVSYRSYWASTLLKYLRDNSPEQASIMELSKATSIMSDDIVATLQYLGLIKYVNGTYILCSPPDMIAELLKKYPDKGAVVNPDKLHWAPLVTDVKRDKFSIRSKRRPTEESGS